MIVKADNIHRGQMSVQRIVACIIVLFGVLPLVGSELYYDYFATRAVVGDCFEKHNGYATIEEPYNHIIIRVAAIEDGYYYFDVYYPDDAYIEGGTHGKLVDNRKWYTSMRSPYPATLFHHIFRAKVTCPE